MVKLSKLYTKTGDDGTTALVDGSRVLKSSARVCAYGDLDELNSHIGEVRSRVLMLNTLLATDKTFKELDLVKRLELIQNELFDLGSQLACPSTFNKFPIFSVKDEHLARLELWIDQATAQTPSLNSFVLPGGSSLNSALHIARAVSRRVERGVVALSQIEPVETNTIIYLNRLSDLLFAWSRLASKIEQADELLWCASTKRDS